MFTATTILAVKKDGHTAVAGDGQVTMGNAVIMKNTARKVRRLYHGRIIAGFAGSVADAFALFDKVEAHLSDCGGNLLRAAVEFAKEWRRDRVLQKLEALLIITDGEHLFLISGNGEVIEPDDGILAIGSGGNYALAAARASRPIQTCPPGRSPSVRSISRRTSACTPIIMSLWRRSDGQNTDAAEDRGLS